MKNELKNSIIYQVFPRNFTEKGDFNSLIEKIDYFKTLNVDILYTLPINPIGKLNRKGSLGSPYSISDYLSINEEYGTIEDFKTLIEVTHKNNMKLMIDIVFNHTSRDSKIYKEHNEWMYKNENNQCANKMGNWSDVFDLDLTNKDLIAYLVDVIRYYCSLGVDGFRFDVASLITKDFYIELNKMIKNEYPSTILLAESCHTSFINYGRSLGYNTLSDAELSLLGFDLCYTYNTIEPLQKYLSTFKNKYLDIYKWLLNYEEAYNPSSLLRIRGLENHDQVRLIEYTKNKKLMKNLAAFPVFMKGPMFIYNGLETKADHKPTLFDKDLIDMEIDEEWFNFILKLTKFKKENLNLTLLTSEVKETSGKNLFIVNHYQNNVTSYGLFSLDESVNGSLIKDETLENGAYVDYLSNKVIVIKNHSIRVKEPMFLFKGSDLNKL